jgi:divalent metal cation (Fe/Co/Zn/Cd) transporter
METIKMTSAGYFKSIKIVHLALVIGVVFFALVSVFLQINGFGTLGELINNGLLLIIPLLALIGIFGSNFIFKKRLRKIVDKTNLNEKMEDYRSALILKFALIEGPSFFAIVAYLLTGNYIFLGTAVVLIIVFLIYTPSRTKFISDLELTKDESDLINNDKAEIK